MKGATWIGRGVMTVLGLLLVLQSAWIYRNCDTLRPLAEGDVAPSLALPRVHGGQGSLSLADLRGQVVIVDFWASWCAPCEAIVPVLVRLHERHAAAGLAILSVNEDRGPAGPKKASVYAQQHGLPFPVVHDEEAFYEALFKVQAYPHLVVVDRHGLVRLVKTGVGSTAALERELDEVIRGALGSRPRDQ
jgi:thiol-disulfide isomerase/thioredoxin